MQVHQTMNKKFIVSILTAVLMVLYFIQYDVNIKEVINLDVTVQLSIKVFCQTFPYLKFSILRIIVREGKNKIYFIFPSNDCSECSDCLDLFVSNREIANLSFISSPVH